MKKLLTALVAGGLCLSAGSGIVFAQDDPRLSRFVPAHAYLCKYNEDKDADDLEDAIEEWTKFADRHGIDSYSAWTLTKFFHTTEQDFDLIWLGAWKDGNHMGLGIDSYLKDGTDAAEKFAEAVSCHSHLLVASRAFKLPNEGTPTDGVISFSNCNVKEDASYEDVASASSEWASRLTDAGSDVAFYHWFPVYGGGGDNEPDMLWVESHPNFAALGDDFERMGNGGFYLQGMELFGDLLDCDSSRAYRAKNRRFANIRE